MKLSPPSVLLFATAPAVFGQNFTFLSGLFQTLNSSGLNQLASATAQLNGSAAGRSVLSQLSNGSPFVLFAPTDNAFNSVPSIVTSDIDALADVIAYHIAYGNFTGVSTTYPNTTLGTTLLSDPKVVQLEAAGQRQALAWATREDGKVHVLNQMNDPSVSNTTTFENVTIHTIDHVLGFPASLSETVVADNSSLALLGRLLQNVTVPPSTNETASTTFFDILDNSLHGFTFFAPNNPAITLAIAGGLARLASNQSAIQAVFQNHLINGSTVYSPLLAGANANRTSAAGERLSFVLNATGHYVSSGKATARIVQPDVLLPNGVIHVIDGVLVNTDSDAAAAGSAASSASSAATRTASATGPIGFSATATQAGAAATGTRTSNAAGHGSKPRGPLASVAVVLVGMLVGFAVA